MGWLFILGGGSGAYEHASRHVTALLRAVWKGLYCHDRRYIGRPIYLIATDDPGHWTNPKDFLNVITQYLDEEHIDYRVLETYDDIMNHLWTDPPPKNIIVINLHGEAPPIPPQKYVIYDPDIGDFVEDYKDKAKQYFKEIGLAIRDYGWLVIEPIGYPFYNASQYGHETAEKSPIGAEGVNTVLSVEGLYTNCWSPRKVDFCVNMCACQRCWRRDWGGISIKFTRPFSPVGNVSYWQRAYYGGRVIKATGAIALGEPKGRLLF